MATYASNELIPSSEFAKKFGTYLMQIREQQVEKFAVLKNNKIEAVLLSKDDYEAMSSAIKDLEAKLLLNAIQEGIDDIKQQKTQPIDTLWNEL